ncbi:MAG: hypothetical protein MJZ08_02510 [Bacteroidaceae bacterium]|nr:hypothetical protein [Bacteroidaceae bacterium]
MKYEEYIRRNQELEERMAELREQEAEQKVALRREYEDGCADRAMRIRGLQAMIREIKDEGRKAERDFSERNHDIKMRMKLQKGEVHNEMIALRIKYNLEKEIVV